MEIFSLVGPTNAVSIFGIRLVGFTPENGRKLLLTILIFVILSLITKTLKVIFRKIFKNTIRTYFWSNQAINIIFFLLFLIGFLSIWFDDPSRLTTALDLVSARVASALQKVITAIAGYVVILRGKLFNVGDRISTGGVRGDVVRLHFTYTSVMEMGEPPSVQIVWWNRNRIINRSKSRGTTWWKSVGRG